MLAEPGHWQRYYQGNAAHQYLLRHYSYSDRIRYYGPHKLAGRPLPARLLHQFMPAAVDHEGGLDMATCLALAIRRVLDDYVAAASPPNTNRASVTKL